MIIVVLSIVTEVVSLLVVVVVILEIELNLFKFV